MGDKNLDRVGQSTSSLTRQITEEHIRAYNSWDLRENTFFVIGKVILAQKDKGVPMGGFISSQQAEI